MATERKGLTPTHRESWALTAEGDCACGIAGAQTETAKFPLLLFLELTPQCNNHCPGCSNVSGPTSRRLPRLSSQEWADIIRDLASRQVYVKLTGGEPTLHQEFPSIARYVDNWGLCSTLLTNGRWPHPQQVLTTLQAMTTSPPTVLVSLHGPDAPSHEAFSGVRGSFDETVTNLRRAADVGLTVSTSTVLTRHNWNRIEEMVTFARSLGTHHVVFNRYIGRPLPVLEATPAHVGHAVHRVEELMTKGKPVRWGTPIPLCASPQFRGGCLAGEAFATVDPWGNVRPCNHAPHVTGNLLQRSLEEIWRSAPMQEWREIVPPECRDCALMDSCRGGCRAEAMLRPPSSYPLPRKPLRDEPGIGMGDLRALRTTQQKDQHGIC